jgi:hypothetical protein
VEDVQDLEDLDQGADHLVLDHDLDQDLAPGAAVTRVDDPNPGAAVDPHHPRIVPAPEAEAQAQNEIVLDHALQEIVPIKIKMAAPSANLATDRVLDLDRQSVSVKHLDPDLDLVVPKMIETPKND